MAAPRARARPRLPAAAAGARAVGALAAARRARCAARRSARSCDDPATVDRRRWRATLVDGGREARELQGAIDASFATGLDEEARLVDRADRGDLGRPRPHGPGRRRADPAARRALGDAPLPARLRSSADGRAPRGVRVAARRASPSARIPAMREPTTQDIDALIGPSTPHFAYQIRERVERLIAGAARGSPRTRLCGCSASRCSTRSATAPRVPRAAIPRRRNRLDRGHAPAARRRRRGDRPRRPALRALLGRCAAGRRRPALAAARRRRVRRDRLRLAARGRGDRRARDGRALPLQRRRGLSRSTPRRSAASPACTSGRSASSRGASTPASGCTPSSCAPGRRRRGRPARGRRAPAYPADDDLLPALTDSAFELLVARLEEALSGTAAAPARAAS